MVLREKFNTQFETFLTVLPVYARRLFPFHTLVCVLFFMSAYFPLAFFTRLPFYARCFKFHPARRRKFTSSRAKPFPPESNFSRIFPSDKQCNQKWTMSSLSLRFAFPSFTFFRDQILSSFCMLLCFSVCRPWRFICCLSVELGNKASRLSKLRKNQGFLSLVSNF